MSILKLISFVFLIIFCSFSTYADNPVLNEKKLEHIPITKSPCYIGCDYYFPYCYNYNIINKDNAIRIKDIKAENGSIKGTAEVNIHATLLVKLCYQLSLASAYSVYDKTLDLAAEFDFNIKTHKASAKEEPPGYCIFYGDSLLTFSSFEFKGDMTEDGLPSMEAKLSEDIKAMIKHSLYKAVYNTFLAETSADKDGRNIYCDYEETEKEDPDNFCPCY